MDAASLNQTLGTFFDGLHTFAVNVGNESRELRAAVDKPPLSGSQGYSSLFIKKLKADSNRMHKEMSTLHAQFMNTTSFQEIIQVCMELYKQNEMWREELEEVLEQDHGIPRVEPPRLVSPAHSHDEKDSGTGEESAEQSTDHLSVREDRITDRQSHQSVYPPSSSSNSRHPRPHPTGVKPLLYSPSADLGLSAASMELISQRKQVQSSTHRYQSSHASLSSLSATPYSSALSSTSRQVSSRDENPSFSSCSSTSVNMPKTPNSSYRPSYADVASPHYSPKKKANNSTQSYHKTPISSTRMTPTPVTPSTYWARHRGSSDHDDLDLDDLSPIRPSTEERLYQSLPATTPTVDLRYKNLIGNTPLPSSVSLHSSCTSSSSSHLAVTSPAAIVPSRSSGHTTSLPRMVAQSEFDACAPFLKAQVSLPQLNEILRNIVSYYTSNQLSFLTEEHLRKDLGLGAKCKAVILFLLHLKRVASEFQSGATVYVPTWWGHLYTNH